MFRVSNFSTSLGDCFFYYSRGKIALWLPCFGGARLIAKFGV